MNGHLMFEYWRSVRSMPIASSMGQICRCQSRHSKTWLDLRGFMCRMHGGQRWQSAIQTILVPCSPFWATCKNLAMQSYTPSWWRWTCTRWDCCWTLLLRCRLIEWDAAVEFEDSLAYSLCLVRRILCVLILLNYPWKIKKTFSIHPIVYEVWDLVRVSTASARRVALSIAPHRHV